MSKDVGAVSRRLGGAAALVAIVMLGAAGSAQAALTLGTDLTQTADAFPCASNAETCTNANLTLPPGQQASAAADGVVTSWKARINGTGPISLQVLHPSTPMAAGVSTSATQNVTGTNVIVGPFLTRQPIRAGELIALKATNATIAMSLPVPLFTWARWEPFLADGGAARAPDSGPASNSFVVLVNAQVEPDADNDHFGDETQDLCPTDATTQGPCPSGAPASKKKCKKKLRSLSASAAKKKCKKHHK
jgi:hypothetical protein